MNGAFSRLRRIVPLRGGVAATVQTSVNQALILGLNFCTGVTTARALGPDGRGAQAAMQMWPAILGLAFTLGLPAAMIYSLKRYPERSSQLFSAALLMGIGLGLLSTLVGVLFIPRWLTEYSPDVVRSAQWLMLLAPFVLLATLFSDVLRAREEFTAFNVSELLKPSLTLIALISLVLIHRLTPLSAAMSYVLAYVPIFVWLGIRLYKAYNPTLLRGFRASSRMLVSYGVRSYGNDLFGKLVAGQLDRVLVVGLLSPAAMGLYVAAIALARTQSLFAAAVYRIVLPKAAARPTEEAAALIGRATRVCNTVTLLSASVLGVFGPWALKLVYGQEFLGAVPVFRLLLAQTVLDGATLILAQTYLASNKPGTTSVIQGIGVGLNVLLLVALVPTYGLLGAGLSMLISTAARFLLVVIGFSPILGVRPPSLWPRWSDFATLIYRGSKEEIERSSSPPPTIDDI